MKRSARTGYRCWVLVAGVKVWVLCVGCWVFGVGCWVRGKLA